MEFACYGGGEDGSRVDDILNDTIVDDDDDDSIVPDHSAVPAPANDSAEVNLDAIESEIRSLYSTALTLQSQHRYGDAIGHYTDILCHTIYDTLALSRSSSSETLSRSLVYIHYLSCKQLTVLYSADTEDAELSLALLAGMAAMDTECHRQWSAGDSALHLTVAMIGIKSKLFDFSLRVLESALLTLTRPTNGRTDPLAVLPIIDLLLDLFYATDNRNALSNLIAFALSLDRTHIKARIIQSQLTGSSDCGNGDGCDDSEDVYAITEQLIQLRRSYTDSKQQLAVVTDNGNSARVIDRSLPSLPLSWTAVIELLIAIYDEITAEPIVETQPQSFLSEFIERLCDQSSSSKSGDAGRHNASLLRSAHRVPQVSLVTPITIRYQSSHTNNPTTASMDHETKCNHTAVAAAAASAAIIENDSDRTANLSQSLERRRNACRHFLTLALPPGIQLDPQTFDFSDTIKLPASQSSLTVTAMDTTLSPENDSEDDQQCQSFLSLYLSSAEDNCGIIDTISHLFHFIEMHAIATIDSKLLVSLIYRLLADTEPSVVTISQWLLYGEICLNYALKTQNNHGSHDIERSSAMKLLDAIGHQLSAIIVSDARVIDQPLLVRASWLMAHRATLDGCVSAAMAALDTCAALLSIPVSLSPVILPWFTSNSHVDIASITKCRRQLLVAHLHEITQSLHSERQYDAVVNQWTSLLREHASDSVSGSVSDSDSNGSLYRMLSAVNPSVREQLFETIYDSATKLGDTAIQWQLTLLRLHSCAEDAKRLIESHESSTMAVTHQIRSVRENSIASLLWLALLLPSQPLSQSQLSDQKRLSLHRDLSVLLSLACHRIIHDGLLPTVLTVTRKYLSPMIGSSLWLSLIVASHRVLTEMNECDTQHGRATLLNMLDELFGDDDSLTLHDSVSYRHYRADDQSLPVSFDTDTEDVEPKYRAFVDWNDSGSTDRQQSLTPWQCHALLLDECCQLYSDLYYFFIRTHPSAPVCQHLNKTTLLASAKNRARLFNLVLALVHHHGIDDSHSGNESMRDSILTVCESLMSSLSDSEKSLQSENTFVTSYLTVPVKQFTSDSYRLLTQLIPSTQESTLALATDSIALPFYHFYTSFVLPAFIARVLSDDDWYSTQSYRKEWEVEHALMERLLPLALLLTPQSVYVWYGLSLLYWEPAMREIQNQYSELSLNPLSFHSQTSNFTIALQRRIDEQRRMLGDWMPQFSQCHRALAWSLIKMEKFSPCLSVTAVLGGDDDDRSTNAMAKPVSDASDSDRGRRLCVHLWLQYGLMAYRLHQLKRYLPTPALSLPVLSTDSEPIALAHRCFTVALRLDPANELLNLLLGKTLIGLHCVARSTPMHAVTVDQALQHFSLTAKVCMERGNNDSNSTDSVSNNETKMVGDGGNESGGEEDNAEVTTSSKTATTTTSKRDDTDDDDDKDKSAHSAKLVSLPVYRLHATRLQLVYHCQRFLQPDALPPVSLSVTAPVSSNHQRWPTLTSNEAVYELLSIIDKYPFRSLSVSGDQRDTQSLLAQCDAVIDDVESAMWWCYKRDRSFYPAVCVLAQLSLTFHHHERHAGSQSRAPSQSMRPSVLVKRLQSFAEYGKTKSFHIDNFDDSHGLVWWHRTPWRGCRGYFKCFERYLQLVNACCDCEPYVALWTSVTLSNKHSHSQTTGAVLVDLQRLELYSKYLESLLRAYLSDDSAVLWALNKIELLAQRACQSVSQLYRFNINRKSLIELSYVLTRRAKGDWGASMSSVSEREVSAWLSQQRWARRLNVSDLFDSEVTVLPSLPYYNINSGASAGAGSKLRLRRPREEPVSGAVGEASDERKPQRREPPSTVLVAEFDMQALESDPVLSSPAAPAPAPPQYVTANASPTVVSMMDNATSEATTTLSANSNDVDVVVGSSEPLPSFPLPRSPSAAMADAAATSTCGTSTTAIGVAAVSMGETMEAMELVDDALADTLTLAMTVLPDGSVAINRSARRPPATAAADCESAGHSASMLRASAMDRA